MSRLLSLSLVLVLPAVAVAAPPAVTTVAYQPGGRLLACGSHGSVRFFDGANGGPLGAIEVRGRVTALAFSPNGRVLAVASGEPGKSGIVRIATIPSGATDAPTLRDDDSIAEHKETVFALAFAPDGKSLATAGYDRIIRIWDVTEQGAVAKSPRLTLKDHSDTIHGLSFHPKGHLLASAGADRAVKVWDAATGKRLYTLGDPTDWVYCVAWSPDGKHLAAGGVDKSIRVWEADAEGGRLVNSVFAHEKAVWRLRYADGGATLFSVGEDRIVKSWDSLRMTERKIYETQPDTVLDLAVSPTGKQLALARFDGTALVLDAATGKPLVQPLPLKPVPPKLEKLTPIAVRVGATTTIVVSGANLDFGTQVSSSRSDVKVAVTSRSAGALTLQVTVPRDALAGATNLECSNSAGKAAPIKLAIDRFKIVPEAGITDSTRAAPLVKLPATLVGSLDRAGDADYFRLEAKAGDQIGAHVTAEELGSKLDAVLVLTDANGVVRAEGATTIGFVVARAGAYSLGIHDREYRGGADFHYRLHVGDVPVVTGVFPLAVPRGRPVDVHIEGVNLSGVERARVSAPADAAIGSRIAVPLPRPAVGKPEVLIGEFPSVVVDSAAGAELRSPASADGILAKPNETQLIRFAARRGDRLAIEVLARRAGSPVDPLIEVLDSTGAPVPRAVLRATAKTYSTFRDHDSAGPGIRLETWNELAIDDYLYAGSELMRILALPKNPDDDCQFYQVAGQRQGFLGTTPAHLSQGSPMYKVEIHPPHASFPPNGLPQFTVHYRNDDGGTGFGKDSFLLFDAPADGLYQVRVSDAAGAYGPTHAYRVTVRPPKPDFSVSFNPTAPTIWKGGAVPIGVTVTRHDGFEGPVRVQLESLPDGLQAPATFVEAEQTSTSFALFAEAGATIPPNTKLKLVARANADGREIVREAMGGAPKLIEPVDIVATTSANEIAVNPGRETRFVARIERRGKFAGRVPVEVRGLPHGVRVLNIGLNGILITERETSREVVLYAEPWVKPMEHPIVVLAKVEGKNTDHAARSVVLKVEK
jgi:WD40 repeat protein